MHKILIRGGMSPFDNYDAVKEILDDSFGGNSGNMVYLYSLCRILMKNEDYEIVPDYYAPERGLTDAEYIDKINREYDCYCIPLADAFRDKFVRSLKRLTAFIKKLKIRVVVISVGMQLPLDSDYRDDHVYDDAVKGFVKAVLDKSALFGVRGENTFEYLKHLRFSENDIRPIGCPSLYFHGDKLPIRELPEDFGRDSNIIVTNSILSSKEIHAFMRRITDSYGNYTFVPQLRRELCELYYGAPYRKKKTTYPVRIDDPVFTGGHARFFLNVPTWIDYNSKAALSVGPRLHGNVVSMLGGTPSLIIVKDGRMQELVEFHKLTCITAERAAGEEELEEIVRGLDFQSASKAHADNFRNFTDFLSKNELSHIFEENTSPSDTAFDRRIKEIEFLEPVTPLSACGAEEMYKRFRAFFPEQEKYIKELQQDRAYRRAYEKAMPGFVKNENGWAGKLIRKYIGEE